MVSELVDHSNASWKVELICGNFCRRLDRASGAASVRRRECGGLDRFRSGGGEDSLGFFFLDEDKVR